MRCLVKIVLILAPMLLPALDGSLRAEILHETGTLRGFLGGSCPGCAYDNWISHISEGIANPGLNDYGPIELDPQTNGFGQYALIPNDSVGNQLIETWYDIFWALLQNDTLSVDDRLVASSLDSVYQFVILSDDDAEYYILREVLNPEYVDDQLTPDDTTDDVRGSFDYGWGVYVYSPSASRPNVIAEMPHPADDYISPYVGTDVFEMYDVGFLMIAGAGREVLWTNEGEYNNNKSLSDPSRNPQSVFHAAHRAFIDFVDDDFAVQVHSFDTVLHQGMLSVALSAGPDDSFPNEPILDRCAYDDMISLTPYVVVPANTCGTHPDITIRNYYQLYYEGGYAYQGNAPVIPINDQLPGSSQNQQIVYSHQGHETSNDPENFVHIEMDELPDLIQDTITVYYNTNLPAGVTFDNFVNAILYYRPAFQALELAMGELPMAELVSHHPPVLNFPQLPVFDSDTLSMFVENISPSSDLVVQGASTNSSAFSVVWAPSNQVLHPGEMCSVAVAFNPQEASIYDQVLALTTNEGCSYAPLTGTGLGAFAVLVPSMINFGPVPVDSSAALPVYIRNVGTYVMHLQSITPSPPHFLTSPPTDSTCLPGQQIRFLVSYFPLENGFHQDTIRIITDAFVNDTLSLRVQGEGGVLPASPEDLRIVTQGSEIRLSWKEVSATAYGSPIHVDGYAVYSSSSPIDSFRLTDRTSLTEYVLHLQPPEAPQKYYQVRAYMEAARITVEPNHVE